MSAIARHFAGVAARFPDAPAVESGDRTLTYRQLDERAERLAAAIAARCPGDEGSVALLLEHGAALAIGALACLKADRVYVPLDRANPPERQRLILEDADARLVLVDGTSPPAGHGGTAVLHIDEPVAAAPAIPEPLPPRADGLAFLLYTSGSTGTPKGVMYRGEDVVARVVGHNRFGVGPGDRLTALGAGGMNLYRALLTGATLVSLDLAQVEVGALARWLVERRITLYHSVPTVFRRFVATLSGDEQFPDLRIVNLTGETLLRTDVVAFRRHFPRSCVLVNGLGTTETGTFRELRTDFESAIGDGVVPVGFAVEGADVLLLDGGGNEVSPGQIGEIAVRASNMSPGYWRRPELTRERFLPPRGGDPRRIYRTGDLGRLLPDGALLHLGREDFQVKVRGNRVEVGEVEAALLHHPAIGEAAVAGIALDGGGVRLVAYAVPRALRLPPVEELRSFLRQRLPEYMVPGTIVGLGRLPLTPNGKVDRLALAAQPAIAADAPVAAAEPRPQDANEARLAQIWRSILNVAQVSVHDDFFALGGDSLAAANLMARVAEEFGVELPIRAVFDEPTLARFARQVAGARPSPASAEPVLRAMRPRSPG